MLNLASADVKESPLWNLTPWRSLKRHVVWFWSFELVASPGWSLPSGCRLVRLSKRLKDTGMSFDEVLKCGSNLEMSPAWAVTSSFFWVVWATAGPPAVSGTVAAAPRAAAPLSRSRRVSSIVVVPPRVRAGVRAPSGYRGGRRRPLAGRHL